MTYAVLKLKAVFNDVAFTCQRSVVLYSGVSFANQIAVPIKPKNAARDHLGSCRSVSY